MRHNKANDTAWGNLYLLLESLPQRRLDQPWPIQALLPMRHYKANDPAWDNLYLLLESLPQKRLDRPWPIQALLGQAFKQEV